LREVHQVRVEITHPAMSARGIPAPIGAALVMLKGISPRHLQYEIRGHQQQEERIYQVGIVDRGRGSRAARGAVTPRAGEEQGQIKKDWLRLPSQADRPRLSHMVE
jgi:hypothetical protein